MDSKRIAFVSVLGAALLSVAVDPVLAQGYSSTTEELIQTLNTQLLYAAIPITLLVEGILIYTVWKFRNNDNPLPTKENRRLEITWTVATAIVLLFVGYASYGVMANEYVTTTPEDAQEMEGNAVEVEVVAEKYVWTFNYEGENVSTSGTMVIPEDRPVYLNVTSTDWLHSLHVPELGLKQDAIPNQHNVIKTEATETGTYQLYCAEYCGVGHSEMLGEVQVVSQSEYQQWLQEQRGSGEGGNGSGGNSSSGGNATTTTASA
ncbi:cytochrome c oxidase subunit II [Haladaptatus pallidirubidus]|uniref:cytochrome-c oxidase n=1 Tax=Haladaptatus pallidirubidus TaxID=1008152 RepID=A0AAV3UL68_9EURY|nr:cytochrome c oxidase subunit II [Haladaptatus pallidirubidus]